MKTLVLVAFMFALVATTLGQDDAADLAVPDRIMAPAVREILRRYFKPSRIPRQIPILEDDIRPSWFPRIRNVRFIVVTREGAREFDGGAYTFGMWGRKGNKWTISFGRWHPGMGGTGDMWTAIAGRRYLRVQREADSGWGAGGISSSGKPDKSSSP